jgi:DNA polymerase-1
MRKVFERNNGVKYIGHNGKFDVRWLRSKGVNAYLTFDTMLAAHLIDENRLKGLKPLSQIMLDADAYAVGDELDNAPEMPLRELAIYNGKDTDYTLRLYHIIREELMKDPRALRLFLLLMMPASNALVDVEMRGIALDMKRLHERMSMCAGNMEKLRRFMLKYVPPDKRDKFNPGSHPQVQAWVFTDLGFQPIKLSPKTGNPSADKDTLSQIKDQHPGLEALSRWRKWQKWLGYLKAWAHYQQDGIVYPTYGPSATVTGRLNSVRPNIQQVPREDFMRSIFRARPGWRLLLADYKTIELRVAAMLADERRMLRMFETGKDIHTYMASQITGKLESEVTKMERYRAKPANFGFLYGMGAPKFVKYARTDYDVIFTEDEAFSVRKKYFDSFPALRPWHDRQRRLVRRYGQVTSPFGRVRHLPDIYSDDEGVQSDAERQAINFPVQTTATDIMLASLIHLNDMLDENECRIIMTVHDSIGFEVRKNLVDEYAPVIKREMEDTRRLKRMFGYSISVPVEVDIEIDTYWKGA